MRTVKICDQRCLNTDPPAVISRLTRRRGKAVSIGIVRIYAHRSQPQQVCHGEAACKTARIDGEIEADFCLILIIEQEEPALINSERNVGVIVHRQIDRCPVLKLQFKSGNANVKACVQRGREQITREVEIAVEVAVTRSARRVEERLHVNDAAGPEQIVHLIVQESG